MISNVSAVLTIYLFLLAFQIYLELNQWVTKNLLKWKFHEYVQEWNAKVNSSLKGNGISII